MKLDLVKNGTNSRKPKATEAREKRGVPPFNTDRAQTLASMDKFEALAKQTGAKVIIQHEAADIGKLPAFPKAAE